jgi:hypothetical protein
MNLAKSLLILWLMTLLVISIAIFTSTFLSWPIAIVLTLLILLGHWGVEQLGDTVAAGIGNQIATDWGIRDPASSKAVSRTVEALTSSMKMIASVLPDISRYSATDDLEQGLMIPGERLLDAVIVTFGFGIPLAVLAYVFLKWKEVAP